ncbi:MAG: hypothetical protein AB7R90_02570 [Reyranellaceae bacterium]
MAARAYSRNAGLPQSLSAAPPVARAAIVFHPRLDPGSWRPAPLAAQPRRPLLNAAAHEALLDDLKLAGWVLVAACCVGFGLALGIHFDEILADARLLAFDAEEPRWLWSALDSL